MASTRHQYPNYVAHAEQDNGHLNPPPENPHPQFVHCQDGLGNHISIEEAQLFKDLECENPITPNVPDLTAYTNTALQSQKSHTTSEIAGYEPHMGFPGSARVAIAPEEMIIHPDHLKDHFKTGTGSQWEGSFNFESPCPVPLPAARADAWTTAQEDHLMALKRHGKTFPEIRFGLWKTFGVDRNPNVLSKKYRAILERNAKENVSLQPCKTSHIYCSRVANAPATLIR